MRREKIVLFDIHASCLEQYGERYCSLDYKHDPLDNHPPGAPKHHLEVREDIAQPAGREQGQAGAGAVPPRAATNITWRVPKD